LSSNNTTTVKDFAKTQPIEPDSKTKVHFLEGRVPSYVTGEREPITVRIDRCVYKEYKPLAKHIYGSTCKAVETHMISLIEVAKTGVYFSHTEKAINIEKIVIERNLGKERRHLRDQESGSELSEVEKGRCWFCGKRSIGLFRYRVDGRVLGLCGFHSDEFVNRQGTWECVGK
jgi:hypothetical protein